jgi:energy-coupling factor transport system substrate-specific component
MTTTLAETPITPPSRWRTLDIVVVAVIGVAFGAVFFAWGLLFVASGPLFAAVLPAQYLISGVWLLPAVICPLIVRKPGAAVFGELVAASVSALIGSVWGFDVLLSGLLQGGAAELVFLATGYRRWSLPIAILAGTAAAAGEALHDIPLYFSASNFPLAFQAAIVVAMLISGALVAGLGGWWLVAALRRAGALESFPSRR